MLPLPARLRSYAITFALFLGVLAPPSAAVARQMTEITSCGQVVTGAAFLSADLDCTGFADPVVVPLKNGSAEIPGAAVVFDDRRRGQLELRGHTLTAGEWGVFCFKTCTIDGGGGEIEGSGGGHAVVAASRRLKVSDVTVSGSSESGIDGNDRIVARNVIVAGNGEHGIRSNTSVRLVDATVTGNGEAGVEAPKVSLTRSDVTGNGTGGVGLCDCPTSPCQDLRSQRRPRVRKSTCGTSHELVSACADTWGVCTDD